MEADNSGDVGAADALFSSSDSCSLSRHASDTRPQAAELGCTSRSGRAGVREGTFLVAGTVSTAKRLTPLRSRAAARSVAQVAVECCPIHGDSDSHRASLQRGCPILSGIAWHSIATPVRFGLEGICLARLGSAQRSASFERRGSPLELIS